MAAAFGQAQRKQLFETRQEAHTYGINSSNTIPGHAPFNSLIPRTPKPQAATWAGPRLP
jgi:hypothetical protein